MHGQTNPPSDPTGDPALVAKRGRSSREARAIVSRSAAALVAASGTDALANQSDVDELDSLVPAAIKSEKERALEKLNFPANCWMPIPMAARWRSPYYPIEPSAASIKGWLNTLLECQKKAIVYVDNARWARVAAQAIEDAAGDCRLLYGYLRRRVGKSRNHGITSGTRGHIMGALKVARGFILSREIGPSSVPRARPKDVRAEEPPPPPRRTLIGFPGDETGRVFCFADKRLKLRRNLSMKLLRAFVIDNRWRRLNRTAVCLAGWNRKSVAEGTVNRAISELKAELKQLIPSVAKPILTTPTHGNYETIWQLDV